ncbi:hypothetical protein O6H91_23G035900 [Diphasiastrum complanatum]|uniref:Uncharacterized protein n=1 Tax=Diphasiastrum complanatum TaxID=34168 RepID=A0ACC2A9Q3_DIPCM|nr:hypothetical protein O6H91_23G035900 [Diphasiastrum complanatum]
MTVAGKKVLVVHICGFPPNVLPETKKLVDAVLPDIVVFEHSHIPGACCFNDILYINPGSAGPRRFRLPRCLSFLSIHSCGKLEVSFAAATSLPRDVAGLPPSLIKSGNICESLKDSEILPESVLG